MSSIYNRLYVGKYPQVAVDLAQSRGEQTLVLQRPVFTNLPPRDDPKKQRLIFIVPAKKVDFVYVEN